jgi:hypothetical protein
MYDSRFCGRGLAHVLDSGTEKLSKWCSKYFLFIVAWLTIPVQATECVWNLDQWPRPGTGRLIWMESSQAAPSPGRYLNPRRPKSDAWGAPVARAASPRRIHQVVKVFEAVETLCIVPIFLN